MKPEQKSALYALLDSLESDLQEYERNIKDGMEARPLTPQQLRERQVQLSDIQRVAGASATIKEFLEEI